MINITKKTKKHKLNNSNIVKSCLSLWETLFSHYWDRELYRRIVNINLSLKLNHYRCRELYRRIVNISLSLKLNLKLSPNLNLKKCINLATYLKDFNLNANAGDLYSCTAAQMDVLLMQQCVDKKTLSALKTTPNAKIFSWLKIFTIASTVKSSMIKIYKKQWIWYKIALIR